MTKKQRNGLGTMIIKYLLVIPAIFSLTGNLLAMMKLEMKSMRKKLMVFFILAVFSCTLLMTVWLTLNTMLYLYLISISISVMMACLLIALLNFLLLVITALCMALIDIDASFPETRKAIEQLFSE